MRPAQHLTLLLALLLAACHDGGFPLPGEPEAEAATTTIAELRRLHAGGSVTVEGDLVVAGRITADDRSGNFYRTLTIEHEGAGMEIRAAVDRLHVDFPVGCPVTLRLRGLALGSSYGVLQAGAPPAPGSRYPTDYIPSRPALDAVLRRAGSVGPVEATRLPLAELAPGLCGTLVRIEGLRYEPEELDEASWAGYRRFVDQSGRAIHTYVSEYADFARREPPAGRCILRGILQYDTAHGRYLLKLRDETDCSPL